MTDLHAAQLYLLLYHDGVLPMYFHEGVPSITAWLKMVADPRNVFYECWVGNEDSERVDIVGMISGTGYTKVGEGGKLEAGMVFCKSVQRADSAVALEFAEIAMDMTFEAEDLKIVALFGTTPSPNVVALRFMKRMGFKECGRLPLYCTWESKPVDAVISVLTREMWYARGTPDQEAADKIRLNGLGTH
jgi:RimJ/RimL family protein N-acetyltransferase